MKTPDDEPIEKISKALDIFYDKAELPSKEIKAEVKKIKSFFEKDQLERRTVANQKCVLDSSESLTVLLEDLDQELQNDLDSSVKDLEKLTSIRTLVLEAERLLSSVPEHETIVDYLANQKAATAKFTELQEAFIQAEEKLNTNIRERDRIEVTYDRFLRQQALEGIEELEDHRVAQYAERSNRIGNSLVLLGTHRKRFVDRRYSN